MRARRIDPEAFRPALERLYASYNNVVYANRDPVSVLHRFPRCADREIVGLLAAGLAYGRVASILKSVETALRPLGDEPARFVDSSSPVSLRRAFRGFRHRWTCAEDVVALLSGVKAMRAEWGSLGRGFRGVLREEEETVLPAAARWVRALKGAVASRNSLLPDPAAGSACKRLCLYLRWMVRRDRVDPGGWEELSPARLITPVDVHMHRVGHAFGFTRRRQANLAAACEITDGFRRIAPHDPVRYDFALTRPGILSAVDVRELCAGGVLDPAALGRLAPPRTESAPARGRRG